MGEPHTTNTLDGSVTESNEMLAGSWASVQAEFCCQDRCRLPAFISSQALPQRYERQRQLIRPSRRQPRRTSYAVHAAKLSVDAASDPVVANSSSKITTSQCADTET